MSLSDRLRSEARGIRPPADPALADRIKAALADGRKSPARPAEPIRFPYWIPAAATLAIAALVWLAWPQPAPAPTSIVNRSPPVSVPAPPALRELLAVVPVSTPMSGEIDAIGADFAAMARTVRGVVPF